MTDKRIKSYLEDRLKRLESIRNEREWTTSELGDIACCKQTLAFIDSLQEEPACEDLEQEITKYCNTIYRNWTEDARKKDSLVEELCKQTARHFAKWEEERVNRRILDKMNQIKDKQICSDYDIEIEDFMSEDLEKSAIKYAQDKYMPVQTSQAFKAGAQWKKQQMMKNCLDYTIMKAQYCDEHLPPLKELASLPLIRFSPAKLLERGLKVGDKVKVIIIKED